MRITIMQHDGVVGVDGIFRRVDLSGLDAAILAIQFDTTKSAGHIEFNRDATIGVGVRDFAAEATAEEVARAAAIAAIRPIYKLDPASGQETTERDVEAEAQAALHVVDQALAGLQPIKKTVQAPRPNEAIDDFAPYQAFVDRWKAAAPPTPDPQQQLEDALAGAVQAHLDLDARSLGYDSVFTATTYADEPAVPQYQEEGRRFRARRSLVWAYCFQVRDDVLAGRRSAPTAAELVAEITAKYPPVGHGAQ